MRYILLIFILLLSISSYGQKYKETKECVKQRNLAYKDYHNDEMKFYSFGVVSSESRAENTILKKYYNINKVSMGCVVDDALICYNKQVTYLMQRKYGRNFWDNVNQQTDSLMKVYATQKPDKLENTTDK